MLKKSNYNSAHALFYASVSFIAIMLLVNYILFPGLRSKAATDLVTLNWQVSGTKIILRAKASSPMNVRGYSFDVTFPSGITINDISYNFGTVSIGLGDDTTTINTVNSVHKMHIQGEATQLGGIPLSTTYVTLVTVTFSGNGSFTVNTSGKFYKIGAGSILVPVSIAVDSGSTHSPTPTTSTPTPTSGPTPTGSGNTPTPTRPISTTPTPTSGPTPTGSGNTPTPTRPISTTPTPTGQNSRAIELNIKLKFQGILRQPPPGYNSFNVKITLSGGALGDATQSQPAVFTSDQSGIWTGNVSFNAPAGTGYKVLVKGPKHIQKRVCVNNPLETYGGTYRCSDQGLITLQNGQNKLDFSKILQLVGDLPNQDGVIDSYDIAYMRTNLGSSNPQVLSTADLNLDGIVDTQDYALLIASLTIKYDEI